MTVDDYSVFVDISVLIDYCTPYTDSHQAASDLLDNIHADGGSIVVSKRAGKQFISKIANQQKLFQYLFREASRCIKDYSQSTVVFKGEVLHREALSSELGIDIDSKYDLNSLREHLEKVGIHEFRREIDTFQRISHRQQHRLETGMIDERYELGGQDTFQVKITVESMTNDEAQVESLVDGIYWCSSATGENILISHSDPVYENKDDFLEKLPSHHDPSIVSPTDAISRRAKASD